MHLTKFIEFFRVESVMTEHYTWILKYNLAGQRIPECIVECDKNSSMKQSNFIANSWTNLTEGECVKEKMLNAVTFEMMDSA